jgi:CIC family chloride channel protein
LTSISLGTGSIGGIFAPGLFIGLTIGYGYANLFEQLGLSIGDHRTYAVAGMAAMFSGFAIAPLTSTLMIVELTGQYNLIFPVLLACLITSTISELIIKDSIYHKGLNELL